MTEVGTLPAAPGGHPVVERFPATYLQEWYLAAADEGCSDLNVPVLLRLSGNADRTLVELALRDLGQRHEALRTRLVRTGSLVEQEVAADATPVLEDARETGPDHVLARPFRLDGGPLVRAATFPADGDTMLALVVHHAVCDGWSGALLARDLLELVRARRTGEPPRLPPVDLQFADYACWENSARRYPPPPFWLDRLAEWRPRLAARLGHDTRPAAVRAQCSATVSSSVTRILDDLAKELRTTVSRVLGAAVVASLRSLAPDRLAVSLVTSNRHKPELRDVVGDLWDHLPLAVDTGGDPVFTDFALRYDRSVAAAYDHQVPMAVLAPLLGQRGEGPLFDVRMNFYPADMSETLPDFSAALERRLRTVHRVWSGLSTLDYQFRIGAEGMTASVFANDLSVPGREVGALCHRLVEVLTAIAISPATRVSELATLTDRPAPDVQLSTAPSR